MLLSDGSFLPVMEHFYTIQGEGMHSGSAAYFIRLAGCDVGCHWCDVKDSWDEKRYASIEVNDLAAVAKDSNSGIAVVTGGEPTMHPLQKLTRALKKAKMKTHLETSGAYEITGSFDWICVSPKKRKPPLKQSLENADELKVIIYNKDDFNWAEENASRISKHCKLFLQPEWGRAKNVMPWITDYIKLNPKWKVSLQIHKYMNIP